MLFTGWWVRYVKRRRTKLPAAVVTGPTGQGIAVGEMARVVKAIRDGAAYGNVHSTMFPAGETRGQLQPNER